MGIGGLLPLVVTVGCGSVRCQSADGQSELKINEANAGAKLPECTSASQ